MTVVQSFFLLALISAAQGQSLTSSEPVVNRPGESITLSCKMKGLALAWLHWIRQKSGKGLEWIGRIDSGTGTIFAQSLQGQFSITKDTSRNVVYLEVKSLKPEDSAVYYCAREGLGYFDYWGRGTEVTVSSETPVSPTLYPLLQCDSDTGNKVTVGCLARDFFPKSITFQWDDASGTRVDSAQYISGQNNKYTGVSVVQVSRSDIKSSYNCSVDHLGRTKAVTVKLLSPPRVTLLSVPNGDTQVLVCTIEEFLPKTLSVKWKKNRDYESGSTDWIPKKIGDVYSAVSVLKVKNADWESKAVYTCEVTHKGKIYEKKASKAPITVTLNPPSPKEFFNNKQAVLECIVNGQDNTIVSETEITWQIDGENVTSNSAGPTKTAGSQYSKTSTLTRSLTEWQQVNTVSCSANRKDMTPVTQDLTVRKGDWSKTTVTVHILSEEDISKNSAVTLVCLVSSSVQQDYYIAWSDDAGQNTGNYVDGITFLPPEIQHGYSVTSIYTIKKEKWNQQHSVFNCNVWPAGSNEPMRPRGVSKAMEMNIAVSCTDDSTEEDEFSSLWSTTSSFIFLFIFTLFYNMIFSLVKMKSQ